MKAFCELLGVDRDFIPTLTDAAAALGGALTDAVERYLKTTDLSAKDAAAPLAEMAEAAGISLYTRDAVFALTAFDRVRDTFVAEFGEEIYLNSARDIVWKLRECHKRFDVVGTASLDWHHRIIRREILALGRLQFHTVPFHVDYEDERISLKKGDPVVKIHIPSSGKLYEGDCLDAYRYAYRMFRSRFSSDVLPFFCCSWLLDPAVAEAVPYGGLAAFASHFRLFDMRDDVKGLDLFRIFGRDVVDLDNLPTDTALQRAMAARLRAGHYLRFGYGIFAHDGRSIIK